MFYSFFSGVCILITANCIKTIINYIVAASATSMLQTTNQKLPTAASSYKPNGLHGIDYRDRSDQLPYRVHSFDAGLLPDVCRSATMVTTTKKLLVHLPRYSWTAAPSVQAAEAIVESPSPKPQEHLPINVLTEISFTSARKLISLSSMAGKACCSLCKFDVTNQKSPRAFLIYEPNVICKSSYHGRSEYLP